MNDLPLVIFMHFAFSMMVLALPLAAGLVQVDGTKNKWASKSMITGVFVFVGLLLFSAYKHVLS